MAFGRPAPARRTRTGLINLYQFEEPTLSPIQEILARIDPLLLTLIFFSWMAYARLMNSQLVRILNHRLEQIAIHCRQEVGKFSTLPEHIAMEKINAVERGAAYLLGKVRHVGPQATRWAEAALAAAPGHPDALLLQHRIAVRCGWTTEAGQRLEGARAAAPARTDILDAAVEFYKAAGATVRYEEALSLRARRDPLVERWADFLTGAGRSLLSLAQLGLNPGDERLQLVLNIGCFRRSGGKPREAHQGNKDSNQKYELLQVQVWIECCAGQGTTSATRSAREFARSGAPPTAP